MGKQSLEGQSVLGGEASIERVAAVTYLSQPSSVSGMLLATLAVATAAIVLGLAALSDDRPTETIVWGVILCTPVSLLAQRGHFGIRQWEFPTIGSLVVLMWLAGMVPSACAYGQYSEFVFSTTAVLYGRLAILGWLWGMAIALGRPIQKAQNLENLNPKSDLKPTWFILVPIWAFGGYYANSLGTISNWNMDVASTRGSGAGGLPIAITAAYMTARALLPAFGCLMYATERGVWRFLGVATTLAGLAGAFIMASRTSLIFGILACFSTLRLGNVRATKRVILAISVPLILALGPGMWLYRTSLSEVRAGGESVVEVAARSFSASIVDADAREFGSKESTKNLSSRLAESPQFFAAIDEVIAKGPNYSPSFLSGVITFIPSFVWPEKNEAATEYDFKRQLIRTGRFPNTDVTPTPLSELVFQLGLTIGPLGGLLYGMLARAIMWGFSVGCSRIWIWLFSLAGFTTVGMCEVTIGHLFMELRETTALCLVILAITKAITILRAPHRSTVGLGRVEGSRLA